MTCYTPSISKSVLADDFTRTSEWTLTKSVTPDSYDLFDGQAGGNSTWTVTVTEEETDSDFVASGEITVYNPHPTANLTVVVSDGDSSLNGNPVGTDVSVTVGPASGGESGTNTVAWSRNDGSPVLGANLNNVATATAFGLPYSATSPNYDYSYDDDVTHINPSAVLDDSRNDSIDGTLTSGVVETYSEAFGCATEPNGEGTHTNNVSLTLTDGTVLNASDSVVVTCAVLDVKKTAVPALDRTWSWTIDKSIELYTSEGWDTMPDPLNLTATGAGAQVRYNIDVSTTTSVDSGFRVGGVIEITNEHETENATINVADLTDQISGGSSTPSIEINTNNADGGVWTIAPGDTEYISYFGSGLDAADNLNTVTVSDGFSSYSATADFNFTVGAEDGVDSSNVVGFNLVPGVTDLFDGTSLTDLQIEGNDLLASFVADAVSGYSSEDPEFVIPHEFLYGSLPCGTTTVTNIATVIFGDDSVFDDQVVTIDRLCGEGTRTPGYWKTHSDAHQGGARWDETWRLVDGDPETYDWFDTFLNSDIDWYTALSQSDQGNPWNTLARAYAAAKLNTLAGTEIDDLLGIYLQMDDDADLELVADVLLEAENWLTGTTAAQGAAVAEIQAWMDANNINYFPTRKELRATGEFSGKTIAHFLEAYTPMLTLAAYLDAYNNGSSWDFDYDGDGIVDDTDPEVGPGHAHG